MITLPQLLRAASRWTGTGMGGVGIWMLAESPGNSRAALYAVLFFLIALGLSWAAQERQ